MPLTFLLASFLNLFFGFSVYALFLYLDFSYQISVLLATILGVVFNYFSYGIIVFRSPKNPFTFIKFILGYVIIYFLDISLLAYSKEFNSLNLYIAQIICYIPVFFVNWILLNCWVYRGE